MRAETIWFFLILNVVISASAVVNYAFTINGRYSKVCNPTYQEMLAFLDLDKTDEKTFNDRNYTCWSFALEVRNNALLKGYRCGLVYIAFSSSIHTIVCFNTTDHGLIYVEPQNDAVVRPIVGQPYWDRTRYSQPTYDDTILYMVIVWDVDTVFFYR